jgi:hypothetical protein
MSLSAIFAGSLFFLVQDEGLTAVWETLLAFQVVRSVLFAYRCVSWDWGWGKIYYFFAC